MHSASSASGCEISTLRYGSGSIAVPRVPLECGPHRILARHPRDSRKSAPGKPHKQSAADAHPSKAQHYSSLRAAVVHTLHRASGRMRSRSPMKSTARRVIWMPGYPQPTRAGTRGQRIGNVGPCTCQRPVSNAGKPSSIPPPATLTVRIHSVSSGWKARLSTCVPLRGRPAGTVTRQSNG